MDYQFHTLSNGIRLVHRHSGRLAGHLAVMINTGSRDELPGEEGLAHFIEHVIFKGTGTRKVHQVLGRLENIGADLNAYTTKEETCIHASFVYYTLCPRHGVVLRHSFQFYLSRKGNRKRKGMW